MAAERNSEEPVERTMSGNGDSAQGSTDVMSTLNASAPEERPRAEPVPTSGDQLTNKSSAVANTTDGIQFDETMHDLPLSLQLKQAQSQPSSMPYSFIPSHSTAFSTASPTSSTPLSASAPPFSQAYLSFSSDAPSQMPVSSASQAPQSLQQFSYSDHHHQQRDQSTQNGSDAPRVPLQPQTAMPPQHYPQQSAPSGMSQHVGVPMPPLVKDENAAQQPAPPKRPRGRPRKVPGTESRPRSSASTATRRKSTRPGAGARKRSRADSEEDDFDLTSDSDNEERNARRERNMNEEQPDDFDPSGATGGPTTKFGRKVSKPKAFVPGAADKAKSTRKRKPKALEATITCDVCREGQSPPAHNRLVICESCLHGWHQLCHVPVIPSSVVDSPDPWFCYNCSRKMQQLRPKVNVLDGHWSFGPSGPPQRLPTGEFQSPAWPRDLKQAWLERLPLAAFVEYVLTIEAKYAPQLRLPGLSIWPPDLAGAIEKLKQQDAKEAEERAIREAARVEEATQAAAQSDESPKEFPVARTVADRRAAQQQQQQQQQQQGGQQQYNSPSPVPTFAQIGARANFQQPAAAASPTLNRPSPLNQQPQQRLSSGSLTMAYARQADGQSPRTPQSPFAQPTMPPQTQHQQHQAQQQQQNQQQLLQSQSRSSSAASNRSPRPPHQAPAAGLAGPAGAPNSGTPTYVPMQVPRSNSTSSQGSQAPTDNRGMGGPRQVPAFMRNFEPTPVLPGSGFPPMQSQAPQSQQPQPSQRPPSVNGGSLPPMSRAPSGPGPNDGFAGPMSIAGIAIGPSGMPSAAGAFAGPPGYYNNSSSGSMPQQRGQAQPTYGSPIPPTQYSGGRPSFSSAASPMSGTNAPSPLTTASPRMSDYAHSPRMPQPTSSQQQQPQNANRHQHPHQQPQQQQQHQASQQQGQGRQSPMSNVAGFAPSGMPSASLPPLPMPNGYGQQGHPHHQHQHQQHHQQQSPFDQMQQHHHQQQQHHGLPPLPNIGGGPHHHMSGSHMPPYRGGGGAPGGMFDGPLPMMSHGGPGGPPPPPLMPPAAGYPREHPDLQSILQGLGKNGP